VLVVDQTDDLKKATTTVGVKRQDTGTAGRVEPIGAGFPMVSASSVISTVTSLWSDPACVVRHTRNGPLAI
jgi:SRSO17 transposase